MPAASPDQRKAADPRTSVWVSANAGSGKTTVLANRVIRLLLAGADPARVLCVTFTKAAAANMQDRIFKDLGKWVALDDAGLADAIRDMTGESPAPGDLAKARRLFARAVETPGGLKIQTIHGFCERLLHLFPFEAAVPARFKVLDEREQSEATDAAVRATLRAALTDGDGPLGQALRLAAEAGGEHGFREALKAFMAERRDSAPAPERKFALSPLRAALGLEAGESSADVRSRLFGEGIFAGEWRAIADWLAAGSSNDVKAADRVRSAAGSRDPNDYFSIFLTDDGEQRASLATKATAAARPDLLQALADDMARVLPLRDRLIAVAAAERTEAITLLADEANARYRAEKRRLGRLDFPDLIAKAVRLLESDAAKWVLYKLDQGLDHVLVDEAQDTSPEQWRIVKALTDDFFTGEGARGLTPRTVFAVGDEKQSIFGFQGAKPEEFAAARQHFERRIADFNRNRERNWAHAFADVRLQLSFRTVNDVLKMVDRVFALEAHFQGLESEPRPTVHESQRADAPGLVELWPPEITEKQDKPDAFAPVDHVPAEAGSSRLARRVAARIRHWIDTGARFEDDGEPITPGDVLVLVRSRGPIFDGVIKALKSERVPVAGADRMKLMEQIAVLDLLSLGRFCLLPEDDLSLAEVLKSPLIGLTDSELESIAASRGATSLWSALRAAEGERLQRAADRLSSWRTQALWTDPWTFYAGVLGPDRGRRDLVARLGIDAEEAINVFQATLRQWQAANPPSLPGFLDAMAASEADVKRDMEEAHGRVRVMTVHGSKGLEARIVFLVDTMHNPKGGGNAGPTLLRMNPDDPGTALWTQGRKTDPEGLDEARERHERQTLEESRRLLYVAITRARDRLYVASARGVNKAPAGSWREMIDAALSGQAELREVDAEDGGGRVHQWRVSASRSPPHVKTQERPAPPVVPDWVTAPARTELPRPPPLRPSRSADAAEPPPQRETAAARADARLRGDLIHLLLQHLPQAQPANRRKIGRKLAMARYPALEGAIIEEALASVLALIEDARFAPLFSGEARAEVDIAGVVTIAGKAVEVSGRIDRIAIGATAVTLMDYKTGRPPVDPNDLPLVHAQQLAVYAALLADIYPDRKIIAAIIWTALPRLTVLSRERLDAALAAITAP